MSVNFIAPDAEDLATDKQLEVECKNITAPVGVDHSVRKHHKNSPSKLPYLAECAGFTSDDTGDKSAAEAGTRLHEFMDEILKGWVKWEKMAEDKFTVRTSLLQIMDMVLREKSAEDPIDDSDRALLVFCIRKIEPYLLQAKQIINEERLEVRWPDGRLLTAGIGDVILIFANDTALVIDYKFGWVPVKSAKKNQQGLAYALGAVQRFPSLRKIGILFLQPKLGVADSHTMTVSDICPEGEKRLNYTAGALFEILEIIERAEYVQKHGFNEETIKFLKAGDHCGYCAHSRNGTCPARLRVLAQVASVQDQSLPLPTSFGQLTIDTPEKAALARYWVELVEQDLDGVKKIAKELAIANGGSIKYTAPNGQVIEYGIEERNHDRTLGAPSEILEALSDYLSPAEILACCEAKLGPLEKAASNAIFEAVNQAERSEIEAAEARHNIEINAGKKTKSACKKELAEIKTRYDEIRVTKKEAKERFQSLLESRGLLSRADGKIPVLKRVKSQQPQIEQKTS